MANNKFTVLTYLSTGDDGVLLESTKGQLSLGWAGLCKSSLTYVNLKLLGENFLFSK